MPFEQKDNSGALFPNKKRTEDKQPYCRGDCRIVCPHCQGASKHRISGWVKQSKDGEKYMSLAFTLPDPPKETTTEPAPGGEADGLPF